MVWTYSIFAQSLVEICRWRRHEKEKLDIFVFLFVCHALEHEERFSHSNSDIVAIYKSILMRISPFFRERNALVNF